MLVYSLVSCVASGKGRSDGEARAEGQGAAGFYWRDALREACQDRVEPLKKIFSKKIRRKVLTTFVGSIYFPPVSDVVEVLTLTRASRK
jgi:hypothetical protein